jgi:hypothetical protein
MGGVGFEACISQAGISESDSGFTSQQSGAGGWVLHTAGLGRVGGGSVRQFLLCLVKLLDAASALVSEEGCESQESVRSTPGQCMTIQPC